MPCQKRLIILSLMERLQLLIPLRDIDVYLKMASEKQDATIKYIFETHFHADFVSGHVRFGQKNRSYNCLWTKR